MVTLNPQIIKVPSFMTKFINVDEMSLYSKFLLIFKGKITSFILNNFKEKNICLYLNLFFKINGKIIFENGKYIKISKENNIRISYPNLRITRILLNENEFLNHLYESYLLDKVNFQNGDKVIDCGANVGELLLSFKRKNIEIDYIGFEPDPETFKSLSENINDNQSLYNIALSSNDKKVNFYVDTVGGNSSMIKSKETKKTIEVESRKLNYFLKDNQVKLLKIDAEGNELDVLLGAEENINKIDYISVDCGAEKGMSSETTLIEVNEYLISRQFKLIGINDKRLVCLYKNENA